MTRYEYDPHTFRLVRLRTEKYRRENGHTFAPDGGLLQDLAYRYDLAGNINQVQDRGTGKGINGIFAFDRDFTYDAIYRLLSGTGIEHGAYTHADEPWLEMLQHHNNDLTQARHYRQRYTYDPAGNILELAHRNLDGEAGHYTRSFSVQTANNRLQSMRQNGLHYTYTYDPNGNMTREATNRRYHWNHADQLTRFRNQTDGAAPSVDACYLYGADGIRVKKVVLNSGGLLKTTTYIGEVFEYCTRGDLAHNIIHLMDGEQRIALLRIGAPFSGDETQNPALQYILGDHLGNSSMTANAAGALLHREELTPYGETSFGGYGEKRYRFTGKERDEESGLSYHRARYYAGWLGKWVSADPAGMVDGVNLFKYLKDNPENSIDKKGTNEEKIDNILLGIRNQSAFEVGKGEYTAQNGRTFETTFDSNPNNPPFGDPRRNASPFGTAAHRHAQSVLEDYQRMYPEARRIVLEPRIVDGKVIGFGTSGAPHGSLVPDALILKPGIDPSTIQGKNVSDIAESVADFKYGAGTAAEKYGSLGLTVKTVNHTGVINQSPRSNFGFFSNFLGRKGKFLKVIPFIGIIAGFYSMIDNLKKGNYLEAVLDAIGFIPIIGDSLDGLRLAADIIAPYVPQGIRGVRAGYNEIKPYIPPTQQMMLEGLGKGILAHTLGPMSLFY